MTALDRTMLEVSIPIQIRLAEMDDLPKLEWYGQYTHYRNIFRKAYREQLLGKRLMLVADSNGFPIGYVFIQFINPDEHDTCHRRRAYLYSFRVMEMFRGYGIGTRLLSEAESLMKDRDFGVAVIAVAKTNVHAQRLYERLGYDIFAEDEGNWSYIDHKGRTRFVHEPCWLLQKEIGMR